MTIEALPVSASDVAPSERFQSCAARTSVVVTVILPPGGENFTALEHWLSETREEERRTRFETARVSRVDCATTDRFVGVGPRRR